MSTFDEESDDDCNGVCVCVCGKGGSGTERTLSVRAAEDPLSDISGSRACAIEVASTTDASDSTKEGARLLCTHRERY
jgi:hypothetical protein